LRSSSTAEAGLAAASSAASAATTTTALNADPLVDQAAASP
jgi:hypothetical protein